VKAASIASGDPRNIETSTFQNGNGPRQMRFGDQDVVCLKGRNHEDRDSRLG
jgi:hypothetical protein